MTISVPTEKGERLTMGGLHFDSMAEWNVGTLQNTDATHCTNYETIRDSAAYLIGKMEGKEDGR